MTRKLLLSLVAGNLLLLFGNAYNLWNARNLSDLKTTRTYACGVLAGQIYSLKAQHQTPARDLPDWCQTIKITASNHGFDP
jgi:hypothetical protein